MSNILPYASVVDIDLQSKTGANQFANDYAWQSFRCSSPSARDGLLLLIPPCSGSEELTVPGQTQKQAFSDWHELQVIVSYNLPPNSAK